MNRRQRKKDYQKKHGYNLSEEDRIRLQISSTIKYTERRLAEEEKERVTRNYSSFLAYIKQRKRYVTEKKRKDMEKWWKNSM